MFFLFQKLNLVYKISIYTMITSIILMLVVGVLSNTHEFGENTFIKKNLTIEDKCITGRMILDIHIRSNINIYTLMYMTSCDSIHNITPIIIGNPNAERQKNGYMFEHMDILCKLPQSVCFVTLPTIDYNIPIIFTNNINYISFEPYTHRASSLDTLEIVMLCIGCSICFICILRCGMKCYYCYPRTYCNIHNNVITSTPTIIVADNQC
jgi:hypothetical protein